MLVVTSSQENQKFSPILMVLKPILILCKCFGTCTLPIFKCSHLSQIKYNILSSSVLYQIVFVAFCELNISGFYKSLTATKPLNVGALFHVCIIMLIVACAITDRKLLVLMMNIDAADDQIRPLLMENKNTAEDTGYKWVIGVICYEIYLYFFVYCTQRQCIDSYIMNVVYRQMPSLLMTSLFCCISFELCKRLQLLNSVLLQNTARCDEPQFLEECRDVHCKLTLATEMYSECFSARVTLLLLMITSHTISYFCFPCVHGGECQLLFMVQGIVQELCVVSVISYCASNIGNKNEEILDVLNLIPIGRSPYKCQDQIQLFCCQVVVRPLKVSALGLFDVDMTTILAVLSVILMYTVIVAQLGDRLESYMHS